MGGHAVALRGRRSECAVFETLLAGVRGGRSGVLVVRGEAGVGKTVLLEYAVESASDVRVLRVLGVQSEMEVAFAALHQLCAPILDRLPRLPGPQRAALGTVFGLGVGPAPSRLLVGLALLSLLSEVAEEGPLLCVVDDAQSLDTASAEAMAFAARRLLAEPVGVLFAVREPADELRGLPDLEVQGLRDEDARALLRSVVRFRLDETVRDRILAEARGNPLALLELPRGLSPTQLAGGFGLLEAQAVPARVEESFRRRLELLPGDTRRLLLVAAAEPVGDAALVWRAAERLEIGTSAAVAAEADGLLEIGTRVQFRHPLVRSAVYRSASLRDRQATHRALGEVTDRELDPDRRAWHLAAAAPGADEEVAAELERSAGRARARGGVAAAAAFLERAVALTSEPQQRAERALAAARVHMQAGSFDSALELLTLAELGVLDQLGRAQVDLLRGQIAFASSFGLEAPALLLKAARQLEPLDIALARETYLDAWAAALFAGRFARAGTLHDVCRAATSASQPTSARRPSDLLLDGLATLVTEGRAAAASLLRRTASVFGEEEIAIEEGLRWGWAAQIAAIALWDEDIWRTGIVRQLQSVREAGLLVHLPIYLNGLGINATWRGEFATAGALIAEADVIAEATGARFARYAAVILAGFRGKEAEASALIDVEVRNAAAAGQDIGVQWCQLTSGILYNGLGRYGEALVEAREASEHAPELYVSAWALPELIEAATRTGETRLAVEALERLAEATSIGDSDWGLGLLARSRALLTAGQDAEGSYREAIDRLSRTQLRPELARAHLLYGEWLRRERRRLDAREQLRHAHKLFMEFGMQAFAERARVELSATGEQARKRRPETIDQITPQELQIARMARDGLSNPEIGARLFISRRTVKYHLQKVFTKLEIRSRSELARVLLPLTPGE